MSWSQLSQLLAKVGETSICCDEPEGNFEVAWTRRVIGAKDLRGYEEPKYEKKVMFEVCICLVHVQLSVLASYTDY